LPVLATHLRATHNRWDLVSLGKKGGNLSVQVCGHVAGLHARPCLVKLGISLMNARKSGATEQCRGTMLFYT